jgi:predicted MFS family arabinose efflux permease
VRETARFQAHRASLSIHPSWREAVRSHIRLFRGPYRARLILVAVLANTVGFVGGPTITYFSLYAKRDHHWTSPQVGAAVIAAYLMATVGTMLCGYLLDLVGRRLTTSIFYLAAGISMVTLFHQLEPISGTVWTTEACWMRGSRRRALRSGSRRNRRRQW